MGWETRRGTPYYYRKVWRDGTCRTVYAGGDRQGALAAELDSWDRAQRAAAQEVRACLMERTRAPAALDAFHAAVRAAVSQALTALGFHQHKRQWRMRMGNVTSEQQAGAMAALAIYRKKQPSDEDIKELRRLLSADPLLPRTIGDVGQMAQQVLRMTFDPHPAIAAAVESRCDQLALQLGYRESSELERLLIAEIVLCWLDRYRIELMYAQNSSGGVQLGELEQWERVLASKQARYLRAIEALARVRRLLKLPAVQVNVAATGGHQVNVQCKE